MAVDETMLAARNIMIQVSICCEKQNQARTWFQMCFYMVSFFSISSTYCLKFLSVSFRLFTVLHACSTVAWSLLPICAPMLASEYFVRFLEKYMVICRACTISRFRVFV